MERDPDRKHHSRAEGRDRSGSGAAAREAIKEFIEVLLNATEPPPKGSQTPRAHRGARRRVVAARPGEGARSVKPEPAAKDAIRGAVLP